MTRPTWQERLWAKCVPDENGCWIWQANRDRHGYGLFYGPENEWSGPYNGAHRWAFIAHHGYAPVGLDIDHLCEVTLCINPDHLEAVTRSEHVRRTYARMGLVSHCVNGHEFTPENTYTPPGKWRQCRACKVVRQRAYRARKRAERVAA